VNRGERLSTLEDEALPRGGSNSKSECSSSSVLFRAVEVVGTMDASRLSNRSSSITSGESAKVTFLCFLRGGGVGECFNTDVLVDGRQYEESSDTSKSRYFVLVRGRTLESVFASLASPLDTMGELVVTWWQKGTFPVDGDPNLVECIGDGVSLVRSIVSGTSYIYICVSSMHISTEGRALAHTERRRVNIFLLWFHRRLLWPDEISACRYR